MIVSQLSQSVCIEVMALKKGGLKADEAVVIENAPLGVEAGHKAGIFTGR